MNRFLNGLVDPVMVELGEDLVELDKLFDDLYYHGALMEPKLSAPSAAVALNDFLTAKGTSPAFLLVSRIQSNGDISMRLLGDSDSARNAYSIFTVDKMRELLS